MARRFVLTIIRSSPGKEAIIFDATMREANDSIAVVTSRPVETGVDITDHIRIGLDHFSVDGFVTDTPIDVPQTQMAGITGSVSGVDLDVPPAPFHSPIGVPGLGLVTKALGINGPKPQVKANVLNFSGDVQRVQNVYDALLEVQLAGELVIVVGSLRTYDDMVIEHLSAPRNAGEGGGAINFTIDFTQIRKVTTKTVPAPKDRTAKPKSNQGQQTPKESADGNGKKKSLLHNLLHGG